MRKSASSPPGIPASLPPRKRTYSRRRRVPFLLVVLVGFLAWRGWTSKEIAGLLAVFLTTQSPATRAITR